MFALTVNGSLSHGETGGIPICHQSRSRKFQNTLNKNFLKGNVRSDSQRFTEPWRDWWHPNMPPVSLP